MTDAQREELGGIDLWLVLRKEERSGPLEAAIEYARTKRRAINHRRFKRAFDRFIRSDEPASVERD